MSSLEVFVIFRYSFERAWFSSPATTSKCNRSGDREKGA
jgi:hypothetical protein